MATAYIYGDSLLKATIPDADFRYHFHLPEVMQRYEGRKTEVVNRSKMGATVSKGQALVEHDTQRGLQADYALVAYGGNDSDFDWTAISADPTADHRPRTELPVFVQTMRGILDKLTGQGVQPVLMTLPPIHAKRYFDFICRNGRDEGNILRWLGDVQIIYRHQELYSDAVARLAFETGTPLIPVREEFLDDHKLDSLISPDGIHLTMEGYDRLFDTLARWLRARVAG